MPEPLEPGKAERPAFIAQELALWRLRWPKLLSVVRVKAEGEAQILGTLRSEERQGPAQPAELLQLVA